MKVEATPMSWLDEKTERFRRKFLLVTCVVIGVMTVVLGIASALVEWFPMLVVAIPLVLALCGATMALSLRGRQRAAATLFVVSLHGLVSLVMLVGWDTSQYITGSIVTFTIMSAFLLEPRTALVLGCVGAVAIALGLLGVFSGTPFSMVDVRITIGSMCHIVIVSIIVMLFSAEARSNLGLLKSRLVHNAGLFEELPEATSRIDAATQEIHTMMNQHADGSVRQSSAVEETRRVLEAVATGSATVVESSQEVLSHAEKTLQNSVQAAHNIDLLVQQSEDISQILDLIHEVANKSDLLALNAALEGTRAGQAGRGFSLVATQMQRLSENVASSVTTIRDMTARVEEATIAARHAIEETTSLARATTDAARRISGITMEQRASVEQMSHAMDDIMTITSQVAEGSTSTIASVGTLNDLSNKLNAVVERYRNVPL